MHFSLVENIPNLARIAYVRQPVPRGDGDAILRASPFIGDEPSSYFSEMILLRVKNEEQLNWSKLPRKQCVL